MILNRLGNKTKIADKIQYHFPQHDIYIELFFGAGGMFFNKPKAKHNFLNDVDDDVYNLFRVLVDHRKNLVDLISIYPVTEKQFKEWGKGAKESTPLLRALRFLIISNYGLYGKTSTMRISCSSPKKEIIKNIEETFSLIKDAYFFNCDFRKVYRKLDYKSNKNNSFCYCDPPYLGTDNNYSQGFTETDFDDLVNVNIQEGIKFAISEFDHPHVLEVAHEKNLNVIYIGERQNLMNIRTEILITNYAPHLTLF